jgi:SagB-type dehydrogenase family enzyme
MARTREPDLARLYHLNSSNVRAKLPDLTVEMDRKPARRRIYPGAERTPLPGRDFALPPLTLGEALGRRRSRRDFALSPLPLETLGRLLYASYGIQGSRWIEGQRVPERPAPSGGGLYPLELYVAAQEVAGLADGLYHYDAWAHELELRRAGRYHDQLAGMTLGQEMLRDANLVVCITAVFARTLWKYGQRGYRYVWLEAGHVGQNLYLTADALGLAPVAIGGFFDAEMNRLFDLPAGEEEALYLFCAGQPRT